MGFISNLKQDDIRALPGDTALEKLDNVVNVLMSEPSVDFMTKAALGAIWPAVKKKFPEDPVQAEEKFKEGCRMFAAFFGLDVQFAKLD